MKNHFQIVLYCLLFGSPAFSQVLAPPTASAATNITCTSFTANWSSVPTASSYFLDVSTVNTFATFVSGFNGLVVNTTSSSVTGLSAGTTYFYRVRAFNAADTSNNSLTISAVTTAVPAAPTANAATGVGCTSFTANWAASAGATDYFLDVSTVNTFASFVSGFNNLDVNNVTTFNVSGLTAGTTYFYRIRALGTCGTSSSSSTITIVTTAIPASPTANAGTGAGCTSFTANWAASAGATHYFLDVSTVNTFASFVSGFNNLDVNNVTTFNVTGLTAGITYFYRVRASNSCGTSSNSSTISFSTSPATPVSTTTNAGTNVGCTSFTANWTASAGATDYFIDVSTVNTFASFVSGFNNLDVNNVTTFNVTGLTPGTTYFYRVRASNSCGTSSNSNVISLATTAIPATPTANPGTGAGCTSFTANWSASTGASDYLLDVSTVSSFATFVSGFNNLDVNNVTTFNVTGLTAGITYFYRVRASNTCGTSSSSPTITIATAPTNTISLTSAIATSNQTVCINSPITNITYATSGATSATFTGLPNGVNGNWNNNVVTISGTPTQSGPFTYTVTMVGGCAGTPNSASGTITVRPIPTLSSVTASTTCFNTQPVITLNGLVSSNDNFQVEYSIGGVSQPSASINYTGTATSITAPGNLTANSNVSVQSIRYSSSPSCTFSPSLAASPITVRPQITLTSTTATSVCAGQQSTITLNGLPANTSFSVNYQIQGNAQMAPTSSNSAGTATFPSTAIAGSPLTQQVVINSISFATGPACAQSSFSANSNTAQLSVNPAPVISSIIANPVCAGTTAISIGINGSNLSDNVTYTIAWNQQPGGASTSGNIDANGSGSATIGFNISSGAGIGVYTGTITIANSSSGCPGNSATDTLVIIKAIPQLQILSNLSVCDNDNVSETIININPSISGSVSGSWNFSNSTIISPNAASGTFSSLPFTIPSFPGQNNGTTTSTGSFSATVTVNGCTSSSTTIRSVTVKPRPTIDVNPPNGFSFCDANSDLNGNPQTITVNPDIIGTTVTWTNTTPAIGLPAGPVTGNSINTSTWNEAVTTSVPIVCTLQFTSTFDGCEGNTISNYSVTLNPTPIPDIVGNISLCHNASLDIPLSASPAATSFDWDIEWPSDVPPAYEPSLGNTNPISSNSLPNLGCDNIQGDVKARAISANGCRTNNYATLGTVTVRPQPNLDPFLPINICNGNVVNSIAVNSCITQQGYTWNYTTNQPAIGLIDSTGTTPPVFTAAITGELPVTGTIVFTPTQSGCPNGPTQSLPINVNPGPLYNASATLNGVPNTELVSSNAIPYEICSGDQLSSIVFTAATSLLADTVKWKFAADLDIQIVGPATEGVGSSTPALTIINNSNTDFKVFTLEVKAISTESSCDITRIYNFQVNPKPVITLNGASIGINDSLILCHASPAALTLGSTTSGENTFAWQHTNTNIGLVGASGTSNPIAFTPDNTNVILGEHSTVTVSTESDKGCTSDSKSFTVSVFQKPTQPLLSLENPNQICSGSAFVSIAVTNPDAALSYTWNFSANLSPSFGEITGPNNAFDVIATGQHSVTVEAISNRGCGSDVSTQVLTASQNAVAFDLGIAITANNDGFIALAAESVDQYFWGRDRCSDLSTEDLPGCNDLQLCFPAMGVDLNNFGYWVEAVAGACRTKAYYWGENACITTLSAESTVSLETLVVYPNPSADGIFTLKGNNIRPLRIIITDNFGRRVEPVITYETDALKIDLSNLAAGVYVIHATGEHSMPISFRIVNLAN